MVSHVMLCISLHLNSQYASQQIKMQKAETVPLLISIAKQIDQIPLQSYCCEVVMEETYLVLRGRFSKVLNLSSPVGFSDGLSRHQVPLKCQNFSIGLFYQQLLWRKMGFFSVQRNSQENAAALFWGIEQKRTPSFTLWTTSLTCYASLACQPYNIFFFLQDPTWTW